MPPGLEDFPEEVIEAMDIYNRLGDRVADNIGYLGKDYSLLPILMAEFNILDRKLLIEILNTIDGIIIKKSAEDRRKALEEVKTRAGK